MSLHYEYHKLPSGQDIKMSISFNKDHYHAPKGYRVSVFPVKLTKHEGYTMEEFGHSPGLMIPYYLLTGKVQNVLR